MKIEGIIFDWAGTTVDFGSFAPVQAFIAAFEEFGITPTVEEVRKPMGMLKIDHIRTMFSMDRIRELWTEKYGAMWTEEDVQKVYECSEQKIMEILKEFTDLKPYVKETMEELKAMGIKIGSTTGYTDEMMAVVVPEAKKKGYAPDFFCTPDSTDQKGRPYPYMIFRNMEALGLADVRKVIKVGDTVSDIKEGKNAGMISVGIVQGSSVMGVSMNEYGRMTAEQKKEAFTRAEDVYLGAGADYVIRDIRGVINIVKAIESSK